MIIKKWNGSTFDEIYPKTTIADVYLADGTTLAFAGGKIAESLLPNTVFDSLKFYNTIAANGAASAIALAIEGAINQAETDNRSAVGFYFVVSTSGTIAQQTSSIQTTLGDNEYYQWTFKNNDAGQTSVTSSGVLEVGDWVVITKVSGSGTVGSPWVLELAVVNNTYEVATSTSAGIIELGSDTVQTVAANAVTATASRTYASQLNSAGQLVVNVPWTDTNTTYTADGTSIVLSGTQFSHADTSNATNLTASGRTYVTGLTFDAFGHVTGYTTGTETVVDTNTTYTADGIGISLSGTQFSHVDTSSQASVNNSNGTVIQDVTLDGFGHVTALGSVDLDGRYFTETEITTTRKEFYVQASAPSPTQTDAIWFDI